MQYDIILLNLSLYHAFKRSIHKPLIDKTTIINIAKCEL